MRMGHLVLEPKDVEVLDKDELKTYWITRQCWQCCRTLHGLLALLHARRVTSCCLITNPMQATSASTRYC